MSVTGFQRLRREQAAQTPKPTATATKPKRRRKPKPPPAAEPIKE